MHDFWLDVGFVLRRLRKRPGMTAAALLTLALGIGANAAIFSVVNGVLLRPLPYMNADRLYWVWSKTPDVSTAPWSIPDYLDYRDQNRSFDELAAESRWPVILTGRGDPERLQGVRLSSNGFSVLGATTILGRTFLPEDGKPGAEPVVVISYGLWQRRFGGDPGIVGKPITLGEVSYIVAGVLTLDFFMPMSTADVFSPMNFESSPYRTQRNFELLWMYGRVHPGVSHAAAQEDLNSIAEHLRKQYPVDNVRKIAAPLIPLREQITGDFRLALWVLLGAVSLVLLIACAILANLSLADAAGRQKEMAIRAALGASRPRLVRQLLIESVVLSSCGGLAGILCGYAGIPLLLSSSPAGLPRIKEVSMDGHVLLFTAGLSLLTGILFGLAPALGSLRADLQSTLSEGGRGSSEGASGHRIRAILVVAEVTLSLVLLIAAGLLLRSFVRFSCISPGFNPRGVLTTLLSVPRARMRTQEQLANFYTQVAARLQSLPGVESVAMAHDLPVSTALVTTDFSVVGKPAPSRAELPEAQYRIITPGYFHTVGIPIRAGREFTPGDVSETQHVALVNQTAASLFWKGENPLGSHIVLDTGDDSHPEFEIVGVVSNVKQGNLDGPPTVDLYISALQIPEVSIPFMADTMKFVIRTPMSPLALSKAIREQALAVDPDVAVSQTQTLEQYLDLSLAPRRFNLVLLGIFALAALFLATSGIYAVISYSVARRTREFGIRIALGAQRGDVIRMMLLEGSRLIGSGLTLGVALALLLTRVLERLLYGVAATDPATFTAVVLLLAAVAIAATLIPARRATQVDPLVALRYE